MRFEKCGLGQGSVGLKSVAYWFIRSIFDPIELFPAAPSAKTCQERMKSWGTRTGAQQGTISFLRLSIRSLEPLKFAGTRNGDAPFIAARPSHGKADSPPFPANHQCGLAERPLALPSVLGTYALTTEVTENCQIGFPHTRSSPL